METTSLDSLAKDGLTILMESGNAAELWPVNRSRGLDVHATVESYLWGACMRQFRGSDWSTKKGETPQDRIKSFNVRFEKIDLFSKGRNSCGCQIILC